MSHDGAVPDQTVQVYPEDELLAEQERLLADLTEQLTAREAEFTSVGAALARFSVSYLARFASLYAELDRLEAEILRIVVQRTPRRAPEAQEAEARAKDAEARARESANTAQDAQQAGGLPPEPSTDLKALYRQVAKAVHPDLAEDEVERERRTRLMAAASQAYRDGDEAALRRILEGEAARPEAVKGIDVEAGLARVLRKLAQVRRRFAELAQLQEALEADPMWRLFSMVRDATERGDDPLEETESNLRRQIGLAQAQLTALRSDDRA
jgi:hypothetical protein